MNEKRAKDIMTTDVIVANKNDIIANVANLLIREKIGGLPVVDEENKVVGIISETDIIKKESHCRKIILVMRFLFYMKIL